MGKSSGHPGGLIPTFSLACRRGSRSTRAILSASDIGRAIDSRLAASWPSLARTLAERLSHTFTRVRTIKQRWVADAPVPLDGRLPLGHVVRRLLFYLPVRLGSS